MVQESLHINLVSIEPFLRRPVEETLRLPRANSRKSSPNNCIC